MSKFSESTTFSTLNEKVACLAERLSSLNIEPATRAQILDEAVCVSLDTNVIGKGLNPSVPPPLGMNKQQIRLDSLALVNQPKRRKTQNSNQLYSAWQIDLVSHFSHDWKGWINHLFEILKAFHLTPSFNVTPLVNVSRKKNC